MRVWVSSRAHVQGSVCGDARGRLSGRAGVGRTSSPHPGARSPARRPWPSNVCRRGPHFSVHRRLLPVVQGLRQEAAAAERAEGPAAELRRIPETAALAVVARLHQGGPRSPVHLVPETRGKGVW